MIVIRRGRISTHRDGYAELRCTPHTEHSIFLNRLHLLANPGRQAWAISREDIKACFQRGYRRDTAFSHGGEQLAILMQIGPMFNRAHASGYRIADSFKGMRVRGDTLADLACFFYCRT